MNLEILKWTPVSGEFEEKLDLLTKRLLKLTKLQKLEFSQMEHFT